MNVDADSLAKRFRHNMATGIHPPLTHSLTNPLTAVTLKINGICVSSHYSHRIRSTIQHAKHRQYLQERHTWSNTTWGTMDFCALKSAFLTLDPIKRVSCSKSLHGWLNTGSQKQHISPTAADAHLCPQCKLQLETQEHALQCSHSSAHKRRYKLLLPMKCRILTNPGCKVQQLFFDCLRQWLVYPDNITPDLNHIPMAQRELVALALQEQQAIGWHL
jgi:hypothetical protein